MPPVASALYYGGVINVAMAMLEIQLTQETHF